MRDPARGEIWGVDLDPTQGREQAGRRPALVISEDLLNRGPAGLVVVLPITSRAKGIPLHVPLQPPEGGVDVPSFIKTEDIRSVSRGRLTGYWGRVSSATLAGVEDRLKILLGLR